MVGGAQRFISARLLARSPCAAALAWPTRSLVVTGSVHQLLRVVPSPVRRQLGSRSSVSPEPSAEPTGKPLGPGRPVGCGANWEAARPEKLETGRPLVPSRVRRQLGSRSSVSPEPSAEPTGKPPGPGRPVGCGANWEAARPEKPEGIARFARIVRASVTFVAHLVATRLAHPAPASPSTYRATCTM